MPPVLTGCLRSATAVLTVAIAVMVAGGCGSISSAVKIESSRLTVPEPPGSSAAAAADSDPSPRASSEQVDAAVESPDVELTGGDDGDSTAEVTIAQAQPTAQDKDEPGLPPDDEDYDPWEKIQREGLRVQPASRPIRVEAGRAGLQS